MRLPIYCSPQQQTNKQQSDGGFVLKCLSVKQVLFGLLGGGGVIALVRVYTSFGCFIFQTSEGMSELQNSEPHSCSVFLPCRNDAAFSATVKQIISLGVYKL